MRKAHRRSYDEDWTKIDVNETADVRYWSVMLDCTVIDLRHAVLAAGPVVGDVHNYLRRVTTLGFPRTG